MEKRATLFRWLGTPGAVPAMAVLLLALLTAFVVTDPMRWFFSPVEQISTSAVTAQLFATSSTAYVEHRWVSEEHGLGFSPALGEHERAFRAGVYLVDLRVAIHENQLAVASSILVELDSLFEDGNVLSQLQTALASADGQERSAILLDAVEASAETSLDSTIFPLGIWTESARLAAAAKEGAYFSHAAFTDALQEFLARDLPKPVASRLSTIDAVVSQGTPESNLIQLQRELRTLILLN